MDKQWKIDTYDKYNPILRITIAGYEYSFTIRDVPEDSHEWLAEVLTRQMQEIHDRAVGNTQRTFQEGMKSLLGIKG